MTDTTSLVEIVSRFLPLKQNGAECHARCPFHPNDDAESLRVGLTAWRCLACSEQEVTSGDAVGFFMSWTGCDRAQAEQELAEGALPEPMAIQQAEVRRVFFWTVKALIDNPAPLVWIHWQAESVHFGREHMAEGRVHIGLCPGRPIDDESIKRLKGRSCILIPDNRESSFERMDELASKLYAAGHAKVRYVKVAGQEECWSWPQGLTAEQALTFIQDNVSPYPNNAVPQAPYPIPAIPVSDDGPTPAGAAPNALPSGISPAVSAPGPQGGAPIAAPQARKDKDGYLEPLPAGAASYAAPGPVAPPGTPKARKSPPDLAVVDDTGAVRKPRLEITVDPDQLPAFSEFALAKAFADGPGVDWRYTAAWGLWAKWNSIRWVQDEKKLITWEARNCCAAVMQEHLADSTPSQRMKVATFKTTNAVIGLALADPRIATGAAQWDADPWLLGTPAGIVDLRTGKTVPPDKAQFISKSTLVAPAEGTHPLFDMVIARPGTGEGMLEFLWRWLGYILSGDVREERFLFLHGLGNSGKGTLIKVIADILGDYARVVAIQAFTESQHQRHSQEIAKLQGARFVYASETEEGSRFDEAMLKWLTGRDKITAHKMRQDDIEFYPQFKLLIYGNNRPSLKSVGEDMRRRIDLIEFPGTIPESERDATLKDRLREEYPAILASMIAACVKWQEQGLGKPQTVANATENYLRMNDVLGEFIEDCLDIAQEAFSLSGAAYKRFSTYCADKGEKYVMSHRTFTQRLETRGYPAAKVGGQRIYRGFALRSGDADPGASERPSWMRDD